jgi:hypothetical protein
MVGSAILKTTRERMMQQELQLSDEQAQKLRRLAEEEGVPTEEIVRRWVVRALDETPDRRDRYVKASRLIGAFPDREGVRDLSINHDQYTQDGDG